jgi:hypothetical protein
VAGRWRKAAPVFLLRTDFADFSRAIGDAFA